MKGVRETADALSDSSAEKTAKLHSSFRIVILHKKKKRASTCQSEFFVLSKITAPVVFSLSDVFMKFNRKNEIKSSCFLQNIKFTADNFCCVGEIVG